MEEIGAKEKPTLFIFNKIDIYSKKIQNQKEKNPLKELQKTWMSKMSNNVIFISVLQNTNLNELKKAIYKKVRKLHVKRYPYNNLLY